ncbi:MAG: hypothetical protein A4S09_03050 [Proteobacteria bacterium SG_bin7]|nr:MAG: hypothetical protein A4S09_03050 [Proteobacteria bacterium SG_bin7]
MNKQLSKLDKYIYETRPLLLLFISFYAIAFPAYQIMQIAGIVLMGCTFAITKMRLRYRGYISF